MTEFLDIEGFAGFRDTLSALTARAAPVPTPCHRGPIPVAGRRLRR